MALSDETIQNVLENPDMKAKVDNPSTQERIKADFEKAFATVKDKLGNSWEDARTIYDMAFDKAFDLKKEVKYVAIGALAYLVSPIDLIPERFLGPLGLADDVAVLLWALNYAKPEVERYRAFKDGQVVAQDKPSTDASN